MTPLERAAQAIWRETYRHDTLLEWHEIKPFSMHHKRVMAAARGALTAVRDPASDMYAGGAEQFEECETFAEDPDAAARRIWQAMIDAALAEEG